jgi:ribosomal protein S18 acetylase RimI-like enzyme
MSMTEPPNISHQPATQEQLDGLFELMLDQSADYLPEALQVLDISPEQFRIYFRSVGQVWTIHQGSEPAGFYWIELRETALHLHALVLLPRFQNRGLGTAGLRLIEQCCPRDVLRMEVGVHRSNLRAQTLCIKCGFQKVGERPGIGFAIYSKRLEP